MLKSRGRGRDLRQSGAAPIRRPIVNKKDYVHNAPPSKAVLVNLPRLSASLEGSDPDLGHLVPDWVPI